MLAHRANIHLYLKSKTKFHSNETEGSIHYDLYNFWKPCEINKNAKELMSMSKYIFSIIYPISNPRHFTRHQISFIFIKTYILYVHRIIKIGKADVLMVWKFRFTKRYLICISLFIELYIRTIGQPNIVRSHITLLIFLRLLIHEITSIWIKISRLMKYHKYIIKCLIL